MMSDSDNETIRIVLRDLVDKVASEDDHYHQETIKSMLRDMVERVNDNYQTEEIEQISQFYLSSNEQISQRLLIVTDVESSLDLSHAIEVVLRDEVDRVVYDQAIDETNNVPSPCIPSSQRHVVTNTDVQQNEPVLNELHSAFDNVYEDQVTYDNDDSSAPNLHWPENPLEILSHKASERIENTDQFENRYLPLTVNVGDNVIYQGDNIDELLQIVNNIPPAMLEKPRKRKMLADKENVDQENTTAAKGLLSLKRARINDLASELSNKKAESQESYVVSARGGRRALGDITNRVANTAVCSDDAAKLPEFRIRGPKTEEMGLFMSCDGDDYDVYSVRESKSVQVDFNHLLKIVYDKDEDPARTYVDDLGMTVSLVSNQIQLGCPDIESSQTKETKWSTYQEPQVDHNNNVVDELEPGEVEGEHAEERDENDEYLEIPVLVILIPLSANIK